MTRMTTTSTPGIYRRGDRYVVVVSLRHGKQRKKSALNMAEAKRIQAQLRNEIAEGLAITGNHTVLSYYEREWLPMIQRTLRKPTHYGYAKSMENHILPALGHKRLIDLTAPDVKRLRDQLSTKLARSTVITTLAPLKSMLAAACEDGLLKANVAKSVKAPAKGHDLEDKLRILTETEVRAFLSAVHPDWHLFFRTLVATGLRISEIVALQWQDFEQGRITVRRRFAYAEMNAPKSGKSRVIPISNALAASLTEHKLSTYWSKHTDLIFPNMSGRCWDDSLISKRVLVPTYSKAGIDAGGFHVWRHTAASRWFKNGISLEHVSLMLGHATTQITWNIYVHVMPADLPSMDWQDAPLPKLAVPEEVPA